MTESDHDKPDRPSFSQSASGHESEMEEIHLEHPRKTPRTSTADCEEVWCQNYYNSSCMTLLLL